jgi:hypothetical protein
MKHYLLLLCFGLLHLAVMAQSPERYASVRISLIGKQMADLVKTGIETDHGQYYPGRSLMTVLSESEILRVQNAGFQTEVLIPDLTKYYLEQRNHPKPVEPRGNNCAQLGASVPEYATPANYSYGTMGGYLTYTEMLAELDKMRSLYPNLISIRKPSSDSILTWEGRPIYNLKISDNPDVDEVEPEVLYTALHHAREPNSASQLIFYMWYLLENYATRPDIQAVVNNLEMYFVPCINVDGYIYNETNEPNGGGFWRKNRRDNQDGTFGVDLNRNYGFFWGDFGGSSPDPMSEIYRGPDAFSEPESRTIRDFCRAHDFLFVFNYHSWGNYFIYPWAYSDAAADTAFVQYARHFTRENEYFFGTTTETVGYNVNGSSDDWMYAEKGSYSYTPEVGKTGFWPQPDEIDALNKENLWQNLSMAYAALRYGEAKDQGNSEIAGVTGNIDIEMKRYGLQSGPINVTLEPFSSNIVSNAATHVFDLPNLGVATFSFPYVLNAAVQDSEQVVFLLKTDNGFWVKTDTLIKYFRPIEVQTLAFQDNLNNSGNWGGDWAITTETFYSAPSCMTDSPNGEYPPEVYPFCYMLTNVNIPANATSANLRFFAKWDIEEDWDFVQVAAIGDNNFTSTLCGRYTELGVNTQLEGPVFDGRQREWVEECMSLADFIGQNLHIEFIFGADGAVQADGYYFDDVRIEYTLPVSGTHSIYLSEFNLSQNEPNPASGRTTIAWAGNKNVLGEKADLLIFNTLGELVYEQAVNLVADNSAIINTQGWTPGVYTYLLRNELGQSASMKMSIMR